MRCGFEEGETQKNLQRFQASTRHHFYMARLASLFLFLVALSAGATEPSLYDGYEKDRAMLRHTYRLPSQTGAINASSGEAGQAASRLFSKVNFVGLSRERVLEMLGDPRTISDYGIAAGAKPDSPLTYRFDSGFGGWQYVIEFRAGIVASMKPESLN
jgi:hypothetical protein